MDTESQSHWDIISFGEKEINILSGKIIECAIEVHKIMGPGLLESIYEECLFEELITNNISVKRQVELPLKYKNRNLSKGYFIDLLVENEIIVELKSVDIVLPVYKSQLLSYLKLSDKKLGLLINFNESLLKRGITRVINGYWDKKN